MTFKTEQLFDTHKRKFCFGNSVDPARINSRISGKGGSNTERRDRQEFQIVSQLVCCKGIYTLLSKRLHIPCFHVHTVDVSIITSKQQQMCWLLTSINLNLIFSGCMPASSFYFY